MDRCFRHPWTWLSFLLLASFSAQAQLADGIAALVNDRVITFSQIRREIASTEARLRQLYSGADLEKRLDAARHMALDALIERELIIQEFNRAGYQFPDDAIENRLQRVIAETYDGDRSALIRTLAANGTTLSQFREELRNNMVVQGMRAQAVRGPVVVSPFAIEQYYQENVAEFFRPEQMKLRVIYMRRGTRMETRIDESGREVLVDPQKLIMQEILHKVETGSDFAALAEAYSEGTHRDRGGDMGWVSARDLRPELSEVAFRMHQGQVSELIETSDGYYLLFAEAKRNASVIPLAKVRDQIEATLIQAERQRLQKAWVDSLRAKSFVKTFF